MYPKYIPKWSPTLLGKSYFFKHHILFDQQIKSLTFVVQQVNIGWFKSGLETPLESCVSSRWAICTQFELCSCSGARETSVWRSFFGLLEFWNASTYWLFWTVPTEQQQQQQPASRKLTPDWSTCPGVAISRSGAPNHPRSDKLVKTYGPQRPRGIFEFVMVCFLYI